MALINKLLLPISDQAYQTFEADSSNTFTTLLMIWYKVKMRHKTDDFFHLFLNYDKTISEQ